MIARPSVRSRMPRVAGALLRTQSDEKLAELAGDGSDAAFEELVRRHRDNLVTFAGTIAPPGYADDVVQDSMLKARAALQRGDRPEYAKAWLFKIVRNTALNERRGWREHDEIPETFDGVEQPPQAFERRHEIKSLVVALHDLPDAQRQALVQRELEGRGHDEIATALNVSPGAVRQLIHRARTTLRAGVGALVPASLLRAAALGGGSGAEQAVGGAAATGLGLTGAKLGLGALLATGAIVGGADVGSKVIDRGAHDPGGGPAAVEASSATAEPASAGGPAQASLSAKGAVKVKTQAANRPAREARAAPPPPPRGDGEQDGQNGLGGATKPQQGQKPPPEGTGTGSGTPGSGKQGGGQAKQPPPPPPPG